MSEDKRPVKGAEASRPTGKRQLAGTSTTSTADYENKRAVQTTDKARDEKPGGGVSSYIPEVVSEMKKVHWPSAKEMAQYTLVVFGFLILTTALVWGVDTLAGLGVEAVLTP